MTRHGTVGVETLESRRLMALAAVSGSAQVDLIGSVGNDVYTAIEPRVNRTTGVTEMFERTNVLTGRRRVIALPAGVRADEFRESFFGFHPKLVGGRVYLSGRSAVWVIDAAAATVRPLVRGDQPAGDDFVERDGVVYFGLTRRGVPALYRTDGTARGTWAVTNAQTAPGGVSSSLTATRGGLFFLSGGSLFRSDGTPAGTRPFAVAGADSPDRVAALGEGVLVSTRLGGLWYTDGSAANTRQLRTAAEAYSVEPAGTVGRVAVFKASNRRGDALWATDGTTSGTRVIADFSTRLAGVETVGRSWRTQRAADGGLYMAFNTLPGVEVKPRLVKVDARTAAVTTLYTGKADDFAVTEGRLYVRSVRRLARVDLANGQAIREPELVSAIGSANGRLAAIREHRLYVEQRGLGGIVVTFASAPAGFETARAYLDIDQDGTADAGEPASAFLYGFKFTGLRPGAYLLRMISPTGYAIERAKQTVVVSDGTTTTLPGTFKRVRRASI